MKMGIDCTGNDAPCINITLPVEAGNDTPLTVLIGSSQNFFFSLRINF